MKTILSLFCLPLLAGCASIISGQNQIISVETPPHKAASCELFNDKGKWFVTTPSTIMINRSYENLQITCHKGELEGRASIPSSAKGMLYGNILAGGIIGACVDHSNGSAYDYPTLIQIPLK
jgi:hypothetical protein